MQAYDAQEMKELLSKIPDYMYPDIYRMCASNPYASKDWKPRWSLLKPKFELFLKLGMIEVVNDALFVATPLAHQLSRYMSERK